MNEEKNNCPLWLEILIVFLAIIAVFAMIVQKIRAYYPLIGIALLALAIVSGAGYLGIIQSTPDGLIRLAHDTEGSISVVSFVLGSYMFFSWWRRSNGY